MTLDSVFGSFFNSALAAALVGLTAFASDFLFVTGTFNFSGAEFAAARDEVFALGAAVFADFATAGFAAAGCAAAFATTLAAGLLAALVGVFAARAGFAATGFVTAGLVTAGFAIDLPEAALVAAALVFFAAEACFTGFFIAFAMESIPNGCSRAPSELRIDGADTC